MVECFKESAERAMPKPTGTAHNIQTLADELDSLGRRLANTQILTEGRPLDDWFGEAANSYASEVSGLRENSDAACPHLGMKE